MTAPTPTPENDYAVSAETVWDPATVSGILTSINTRLKAQEALIADYQSAIDQLNNLGLQVIADNLGPVIQDARDQLTALQADILAAQDQIAVITQGGIEGTGVVIDIEGLEATNAQAAIAEILNAQAALGQALTTLGNAVAALTHNDFRPWSAITADSPVAAYGRYVVSAGITVTLPISTEALADGAEIEIWPSGLNQVLDGNGRTIEGQSSVTIDQENTGITLVLISGDWKIRRWSIING